MAALRAVRGEVRPLLKLAWPLVLGEVGWMTMGLVDTMMVGRVSKEAMGGVGLGSILFFTVFIIGYGVTISLDTLVPQSFGARRFDDCNRSVIAGVWMTALLSPVLMALTWAWTPLLGGLGVKPEVVRETGPYLEAVLWSTFPLVLHAVLRRYLQGMNIVKPVMFSMLSANLVNVAANWALIFGHWGFPAMGSAGAGWATCASRLYMALVLVVFILYRERIESSGLFQSPWRVDFERMRDMLRLGLPAAAQFAMEVGVFAAVTTLLGRLEPEYLAAHQIALNAASYTFMVPLGLSAAASVRVGQAIGRGDAEGARRAGWAGIALAVAFMSTGAAAFLLAPRMIARAFTTDATVIAASVSLLAVAAMFQLFDGTQVVATGALRGAGDTRTPAICHMIGYWFAGLPIGYWLCFHAGMGATGLWLGLCLALISIGIVLGTVWHRTSSRFEKTIAVAAAV